MELALKDINKELKKYFNKYGASTNEIFNKLDLLEEIYDNKNYEIAVVANMSAGKSMFINSLLGEEILPSFNEATSDSPVIIEPSDEFKAIIEFEDDKQDVVLNENEIDKIKLYAKKDTNDLEQKYKNVNQILIKWPFKNLEAKNVNIKIIDTPGPNNTGEFKDKHKKMTRKVLRNVNAAIFLFDYTQLDANLESDEQGLWYSIKERVNHDDKFKVIFVLNKIDEALEDNYKIDNNDDSLKNNWFKKESEAIEKLKEAAKAHGINNPIILPVSAKLALYMRKNNITRTEKKFIHSIKDDLEYVFDNENIEDKLIEYAGIEEVEKYLNEFINKDVIEIINNEIHEQLLSILNEEINRLNVEIDSLSKPYEKTLEDIAKTKNLIKNLLPEKEKNLNKIFQKNIEQGIEEVETILKNRLNEIININLIISQLFNFLERITKGEHYTNAKKLALKTKVISSFEKNLTIDINYKKQSEILKNYEKFKKGLFESYSEKFNDSIAAIIKNKFRDFETKIYETLTYEIIKIEKEINKSLDLKHKPLKIKPYKLNIDIKFDNDVKIDSKTYKKTHKKKEYKFNIFGWKFWKTEKSYTTTVTKNYIVIDTNKIKTEIQILKKQINDDIGIYIDNIVKKNFKKLQEEYLNEFNTIKNKKIIELTSLEHKLNNAKQNIEKVKKQLKTINNIKGSLNEH